MEKKNHCGCRELGAQRDSLSLGAGYCPFLRVVLATGVQLFGDVSFAVRWRPISDAVFISGGMFPLGSITFPFPGRARRFAAQTKRINKKNKMIDRILPGVAALDLGAEKLFCALADAPVKSFGTFSADLRVLGDYLKSHQIKRVAMEATGVYWIPVHDYLQGEGMEVTVFHGAHARNLPGRKSDVQDCQWHAMLHSFGLLSPCFIPPEEIRQLRSFYRLRDDHLSMAASHIQHMERALDLMNVRLHQVISQIHGVSGLRVIDAILAGERDPLKLASLCDVQIIKNKHDQVVKSLEGDWRPHHLFALRQALECYRFYHRQIADCDAQIATLLQTLNAGKTPPPSDNASGHKTKKVRHNAPAIPKLHSELVMLSGGLDATVLPGISPLGFMKLLGELGSDLSKWKNAKAFTNWLGLSPGKHQSGNRSRRVRRRHTVAGQIFREAVLSLAKSKYLALGAFYRRLKGRKSAAIAATATARKLAVLYYQLMTRGRQYVETGLEKYEAQYQEQSRRYVTKLAARLGLVVGPAPTA